MHSSLSRLGSIGFVSVAYPVSLRKAVAEAFDSWKKFTELPLELKKSLPYSNKADGVGYEYKDGSGTKVDKKENFDVTVASKTWLKENGSKIGNPDILTFIDQAGTLVELMRPIVLDFARNVEKEFGVHGLVSEVEKSDTSFFVRFIHYFGGRENADETASSHVDQSGFTLHLFESHPGLQCLSYGGEWVNMPVSEGKTVIIPAMQLQLRTKGTLKALCHRVVANAQTAREGRYSAVCFVQLAHTPKYDKDTHGRLQEKIPGFNYGMLPDEFAKLFMQS
jgi:isopenicillin N synthase-like dioxygenase